MATLKDLITQARNLMPWKLLDDDPLEEGNWNTLIDLVTKYNEIFDKIDSVTPPVGFIYIRLPGAKEPDELWDHPQARWRDISHLFPGVFFRVKGGNASSFNEFVSLERTTPPSELIYDNGDGGSGGGQMDAIRNMIGSYGGWALNRSDSRWADGVFKIGINTYPRADYVDATGSAPLYFDASRVVPVASDNHPQNITIEIWIREEV